MQPALHLHHTSGWDIFSRDSTQILDTNPCFPWTTTAVTSCRLSRGDVTDTVLGCCFFSSAIERRIMVHRKAKRREEGGGRAADRGSDRCSGPEEARTCDRLGLTRPSSGKKKWKEKNSVAMVTGGRLREKMDVSQAYLGEIISFDTVVAAHTNCCAWESDASSPFIPSICDLWVVLIDQIWEFMHRLKGEITCLHRNRTE